MLKRGRSDPFVDPSLTAQEACPIYAPLAMQETLSAIATASVREDEGAIFVPSLPALERIDVPIDVEGRVAFRETRPRAHDVRLPRLRLPISVARRIGDRIRRPKRAD